MDASDALALLRDCGLRVVANADALVIRPRSMLTDGIRALIRTHKAEILDLLSDEHEFFEERAAIREFDGGMSRPDAEAFAEDDLVRYRQALERYRQACLARLQRNAAYIRRQPTAAARERALKRYRQAAEARYGAKDAITLEKGMRGLMR